MKVGEVYIYDSNYSTNIIKIREIYYDSYYKKVLINVDELDMCFKNNEIHYRFTSIRIESLENNISFKRVSEKDWHKVLRRYNKLYFYIE